jgi:hypothetical protein
MSKTSMDETLERLDAICDALHRLAQLSRDKNWPEPLQVATAEIAQHVELLAGALDMTDGNAVELGTLVAEARARLPEEFAAFGTALSADVEKLTVQATGIQAGQPASIAEG